MSKPSSDDKVGKEFDDEINTEQEIIPDFPSR